MLPIGATNLQLYGQLRDAGWAGADIQAIHATYRETAVLASRMFRANWKPFLAHLVGTASITAWDSGDRDRVRAALAHSALEFGHVPFWVHITKRRHAYLETRLGADVFRLVRAYHTADWKRMLDPDRPRQPAETAVVHIKLADMLDDLTDELSPVATKKKVYVSRTDDDAMRRCADLAEAVGAPNLRAGYEALRTADVPDPAIREARSGTFLLKRSE